MVVKMVAWLHEVIYSVAGKLAAYEDLSMPLFMQGYLIVMKGEERAIKEKMATHVEEIMGGTELYGWERVKVYHSVSLNQLEQGWAMWQEEGVKLMLWHALIWHLAILALAAATKSAVSGTQMQPKSRFAYNAPANPGTKACQAFNERSCTDAAAHPNQLHVCSHCLVTPCRTLPHKAID